MSIPRTSDNRPIYLTSKFRGGVDPYLCGAGDDEVNGRGMGTKFEAEWTSAPGSPEDKTVTFSFNDWVYVASGGVNWLDGELGDRIDMWVSAPASTVTANAGSGDCNLVATGLGFNAIVPAAGDGSHDVDTAIPVPSTGADTGYWDWDEPDEGKGSITASATPGAAVYNLYDAELKLVHWVCNVPMIGSGALGLDPETKARKILPHWDFKTKVHTEGGHTFACAWWLNTARKKTP